MKAYVLHAVNELSYDDIDMPDCPEDWVILKVKAAGICSSDVGRVFSKGTYNFPTIPGHEFAGEVYSVGNKVDKNLIGKRVGVFPLIPCRSCQQCLKKHYEMCTNYDYLGSRRDGGFAEFVAVPVWNLIQLPETISFISAAMLEPLSVALHAIKMSGVIENQSVAIVGTGMIGISAGQWAHKLGANKVSIIGRNENKRKLIESCNLEYIVYDDKPNNNNYDIVIEAVGSPSAIEMSFCISKPGGTIVLMGNPSGNITLSQALYWQILRKQLIIKGTWNSSFDGINKSDWTDAIEAIANNQVNVEPLASHIFKQDCLMDGLYLMHRHIEPYCKVVTIWND